MDEGSRTVVLGHTARLKCLIPTIGSPALLGDREGRYVLAEFYGGLLEWRIVNQGWVLIGPDPATAFYLAFGEDGWSDVCPPRWPDPRYPQQQHLDIAAPDPDAAASRILEFGGRLLSDAGTHRIYADPAGHPLCVYGEPNVPAPTVARIVADCYSPRALATFYEGFLGVAGRTLDTADRVELDLGDPGLPALAFQQAQITPPRWPDPEYPAQLHIDYRWHDTVTARAAVQRAQGLGMVPLRREKGVFADPVGHPLCVQNDVPAGYEVLGVFVDPPWFAVAYGAGPTATGELPPPDETASTESGRHAPSGFPGTVPDDAATMVRDFLEAAIASLPTAMTLNIVCPWIDIYESSVVQTWLRHHRDVIVHRSTPGAPWTDEVSRWIAFQQADSSSHDQHDGDLAARVNAWMKTRRPGSIRWGKPSRTGVNPDG